ncbi:MAG TPA: OmpA family protein [Azospirillaceae bacterium]|nr:OmpA family protein [Azospirillaceae bacterium]
MKMGFRFGLASAALVAAGLLAAPAMAQDMSGWCNSVLQSKGDTPVVHKDGLVLHKDSYKCAGAAMKPQAEYLVFFDWNKSNVTPAADKTLGDAVAAWGKDSRIHVIGHTDTSGSPAYNQRLSERRATSVKDALVKKGVAAANVTTEGKGETTLLVKTKDGVREPSNRRAQVLNRSITPSS